MRTAREIPERLGEASVPDLAGGELCKASGDKPVYPHWTYGLLTLSLAALNTRLTQHGYVLHPTKVRNADWSVIRTALHGETEMFGWFELRPAKKGGVGYDVHC